MKKFILISLFLVVSTSSNIWAQDTLPKMDLFKLSLAELMQIKVSTPTRVSQDIEDVPATVYVITHAQIEHRNYSCLRDLLADIPQIEIQRHSQAEVSDVFTINGISGNEKFIIMQDGIRINSMIGTANTIGESYTLENTKQVEVVLSPASALYGADAFLGIINIITFKTKNYQGIHLHSNYGMFQSYRNSLIFNEKIKSVAISMLGKYYQSAEAFMPRYYPEYYRWYHFYKQTGKMAYWTQPPLLGDTVDTGMGIQDWAQPIKSYNMAAKVLYKNIEIGYSQFFEQHSTSFGKSDIYIYSMKALYATQLQNWYLKNDLHYLDNHLQFYTTLSAQNYRLLPQSSYINIFSNYQPAYKYEKGLTQKWEEQINYVINKNNLLIGGFSFENMNVIPITSDLPTMYNENKSSEQQDINFIGTNIKDYTGANLKRIQDIYHLDYWNFGSYMQWQSILWKNINLTAGLRYDYNSRYKSTLNPRLGLVLKASKKLRLKFLYAHSYLAPSFFKAYKYYGAFYPVRDSLNRITGLASSFWHLTNPDLKPERRQSYDFNLIYQGTKDFLLSFNSYYAQVVDLIGFERIQNGIFHTIPVTLVERNVNKGKAQTYGATIRADVKLLFSTDRNANAFIAYTFSDGKINNNTLYLNARHTIKAGLDIKFYKKINVYTKFIYRSAGYAYYSTTQFPIQNKAFYRIDLSANYLFLTKEKYKVRVFVKVFNLTDNRYYNLSDDISYIIPQDPIRIDFGLKIGIGK